MVSLSRVQIHRRIKHWRLQAKAEKAKIIAHMQQGASPQFTICTCCCQHAYWLDHADFEEATALLPEHLRQQLDDDHNWTFDHAVIGAAAHEDNEHSGLWLQVRAVPSARPHERTGMLYFATRLLLRFECLGMSSNMFGLGVFVPQRAGGCHRVRSVASLVVLRSHAQDTLLPHHLGL